MKVELGLSERRVCRALGQHRSTQHKVTKTPDDEAALTAGIIALAHQYGRYGYRRITALLREAGWSVNKKRVERIWRREGLKVPHRQPKRGRLWLNDGLCIRLWLERTNHAWSYAFVADSGHDGKTFCMLCIIDEFSCKSSAVEVAPHMRFCPSADRAILFRAMTRYLWFPLVLWPFGALALTGNAPPATGWAARPIVMVVDALGELCTGTALARDLVLTAAHCVTRNIDYQVKVFQTGQSIGVRSIAQHPRYDHDSFIASRATADIALLKLSAPLPDVIRPAALAPGRRVAVGEKLTVAGFGVTIARTDRGLGVPRMASLAVTGKPGSLQIRLFDPATRNIRAGLGGCTGDSGSPAFDGQNAAAAGLVIGVVSWSTGPEDTDGCGGLTGVTPLLIYRGWIIDTSRKFNSPISN